MHAALAATPPAVALILLLARVRPTRAAIAALASTAAVAALAFPTPISEVLGSLGGVAPTCVEIAAILLGGVLLNELTSAGGGDQELADWLTSTCREPARAVVLIVLGVTPFAESVTGFGVGVVVAVPLLRRIGLTPTRAAITGLVGLVTVPWGALGPGTLVAARFTGIDSQELGILSAAQSIPVFFIAGLFGLVVAVGRHQAMRAIPELIAGVMALGVGVYAVNATIGVPLAGVLGGLFSVLVLLSVISARERRFPRASPAVWRSLRPYGTLVVGLLSGRLIATVATQDQSALNSLVTSPAVWLLLTCALTPTLLSAPRGTAPAAVRAGLKRWFPVASTTVAFLVLGAVLTATGMSAALAAAAASLGNPAYLLVAPLIGAFGGFITGSNTGSNAMFATSQATAAQSLGVSVPPVVAVQNVASSLATTASVSRIVLAVSLAAQGAIRHGAGEQPESRHDPTASHASDQTRPMEHLGNRTTTEETEHKADERTVLRTVLVYNVLALVALEASIVLFIR